MRTEHHEVIVVGAGTSGVTVGGALSAAGRSVLLIDRAAANFESAPGAAVPLFRLRNEDLGDLAHFDGTSPAWPIDGIGLNRWYAFAETVCAVRGGDPAESPAGRPLPFGADVLDPAVLVVMHRFRAAGLQPFPTPVGATPAGTPAGCDAVVGSVQHIETDATGREARAVVVEHEGRRARYAADAIVLAAGATGSASILLRSVSDRHPAGLANRSGAVGRNLVRRSFALVLALMKREPPASTQPGFTLADFYLRSPGWRYPGGHVRLIGSSHRRQEGAAWPGPAGVRSLHSLDFLLAAEGLPDPGNRVDIGRNGEVTVHWRPTNLVALRKLSAQMRHVLSAIGSACVHAPLSLHPDAAARLLGGAGSGTVRMGIDPATSAVRPDGRAHDVANLWVADASTFPSAGAIDPALTQVALGLRAADAIDHALGAAPVAAGSVAAGREGWAA